MATKARKLAFLYFKSLGRIEPFFDVLCLLSEVFLVIQALRSGRDGLLRRLSCSNEMKYSILWNTYNHFIFKIELLYYIVMLVVCYLYSSMTGEDIGDLGFVAKSTFSLSLRHCQCPSHWEKCRCWKCLCHCHSKCPCLCIPTLTYQLDPWKACIVGWSSVLSSLQVQYHNVYAIKAIYVLQ